MDKTQRELAFLRDLYIQQDWTRRFTELADKHLDVKKAENLLYLNAGTGTHCLALRERVDEDTAIFARCEDEELANIARDKALAVKADVDHSTTRFEDESFDSVIAEGSLVEPESIEELVNEAARVTRSKGRVLIMMPTAGSFGEIFSLLWEAFFSEIPEQSPIAEELVLKIPTISKMEEWATSAGLEKVETHIANEVFDYDDAAAFLASPLVMDFLMPRWLEQLSEEDSKKVTAKLSELIESEGDSLTFRFSVKATVLTGQKA